ncbi:MAG: ArnT family glycosyltransferase [Phycisphaerae bacterium]
MSTYPLAPAGLTSSRPPESVAVPAPRKGSTPALAERPLWPTPEEESGRRWLAVMVFIAIVGLYAYALSFFYAGAHAGVDQNGYLMTARLIAGDRNIFSPERPAPAVDVSATPGPLPNWTGYDRLRALFTPQLPYPLRRDLHDPTADLLARAAEHPMPSSMQQWHAFDWLRNRLSFVPETPYQFAGRMDIITEPYGPADAAQPAQYRVYAKYPFGFPLLAALGRLIGGIDGMYVVNPLCTVLACYFAYFLFRQAVTPFMSLLGVIWLACNPLVLYYANDANSHASTLFCVTVGFWGVLSWLRTGQNWRAWIGGFALGYACTIRYSEFLLVLPVLFAALLNFRMNWKRAWGSLSLMLAWSIPIAVLAGVCWIAFGAPWKTGYTYCRESTGFAWKYLSGDFGDGLPGRVGNWETMVTQLNHTGLFVLWPLAIAGLFAMAGSAWRLGMLLALWVLPSTLLYMLYYWAPGGENTLGYMRFFMSIVPGLVFAGLWLLDRGLAVLRGERWASLLAITAFGAFFFICVALYLDDAPIELGLPLLTTTWAAVRDFVWESWLGMGIAGFILLVIAGIWIFDREFAAAKVGMALGAGILTAIGCGINLHNFMPQVMANYTQFVGLRSTVNVLRKKAPAGTVIFSEDRILNDLDAVGGWQLINDTLFNGPFFADSKRRVEIRDSDKDKQDDPDPIQLERSRFYEELLGVQDKNGNWNSRPASELRRAKMDLITHYLAEGRRVMFVRQESPRVGRVEVPPTGDGCVVKKVEDWEVPTMQMVGNIANVRAFGGKRRFAVAPQAQTDPPRHDPQVIYRLWEIAKAPASAATGPALTAPTPDPAPPAPAAKRQGGRKARNLPRR